MFQPVSQSEFHQQVAGMRLPLRLRHTAIHGGNFSIFNGTEIGHKVVALKNETKSVAPQRRQFIAFEARDINAADGIGAARWLIETPEDIHERGLARAGCTHDGDEFSALNR